MKIAIVRAHRLNKWHMQIYEPLTKYFDLTAFTTNDHIYDIDQIDIPIKKVPYENESGNIFLRKYKNFKYRIKRQKEDHNFFLNNLEEELRDFDIINTMDTGWYFSYQAIRAKKRYGAKLVVEVWENIPFNFESHPRTRKWKEEVRRNADFFVAYTQRSKETLLIEGVAEQKIEIIPAGIDLQKFHPCKKDIDLLQRFNFKESDLIVLFVGRLVWQKGIYDFIYAAKKVLQDPQLNNYHLKFLIVGDGPEIENIKGRISQLHIEDRIVISPSFPYAEMGLIYNLADIFVFPSVATENWQEQFGMALIESMACGKAIISTFSGSIPEVVEDAGVLIQPNDFLSIYQHLKRLILDENLRAELGNKARKRAEENFDCQKIAEQLKRIYQRVIRNHRRRIFI